jgi:hypothetical protein
MLVWQSAARRAVTDLLEQLGFSLIVTHEIEINDHIRRAKGLASRGVRKSLQHLSTGDDRQR